MIIQFYLFALFIFIFYKYYNIIYNIILYVTFCIYIKIYTRCILYYITIESWIFKQTLSIVQILLYFEIFFHSYARKWSEISRIHGTIHVFRYVHRKRSQFPTAKF